MPRRSSVYSLALVILLIWCAYPVAPALARQVPPGVVPTGQAATAGPWQMQVVTVQTGDAAATAITAASPANPAPPDGEQYVVVEITATNGSDRPQGLDPADFALIGDGWVGRASSLVAPEPSLMATVEPGAAVTGFVALSGPDSDAALVLLYDSVTLGGNWADALFALADGAVPPEAPGAAAPTDAGTAVGEAVAIGDPVATAEWQVSVAEVVVGDPVYDLYPDGDYRTTALGRNQAGDLGDADGDGAAGWVAVRVAVTYTGTVATGAYLSADAFTLAQQDGGPVPNGLFLTAPAPAAEGWYTPGQSREGWLVFEIQIAWDSDAMRFQADATDADRRYLLIY